MPAIDRFRNLFTKIPRTLNTTGHYLSLSSLFTLMTSSTVVEWRTNHLDMDQGTIDRFLYPGNSIILGSLRCSRIPFNFTFHRKFQEAKQGGGGN